MATRLYLTLTAGPSGAAPARSARWTIGGGGARRRAVVAKIDGASGPQEGASTATGAVGSTTALMQFITDPVPAQVIAGTISGFRGAYAQFGAAGTVYLVVRAFSGDLATARGELYYGAGGGEAFPTSGVFSVAAPAAGTPLTSVQAEEGDRIVIEIGVTRTAIGGTGEALQMANGAYTADSDFSASGQSFTGRTGWIEFSQDLWPATASLAGEANSASGATGEIEATGGSPGGLTGTCAAVSFAGGDIDVYEPVPVTGTAAAVTFAGGDLTEILFLSDG